MVFDMSQQSTGGGRSADDTLPLDHSRLLMVQNASLTCWEANEPSWLSTGALVGDLLPIYVPWGWWDVGSEQPSSGRIGEAFRGLAWPLVLL